MKKMRGVNDAAALCHDPDSNLNALRASDNRHRPGADRAGAGWRTIMGSAGRAQVFAPCALRRQLTRTLSQCLRTKPLGPRIGHALALGS
jgi:hypothetical protein